MRESGGRAEGGEGGEGGRGGREEREGGEGVRETGWEERGGGGRAMSK